MALSEIVETPRQNKEPDYGERLESCVKPIVLALQIRCQLKWEYPLNLSILLRGGKETNKDSPSNGE